MDKSYQLRVIEEQSELQAKIDKLKAFINNSDAFNNLSERDRELLIWQQGSMMSYSAILQLRINNLYKNMEEVKNPHSIMIEVLLQQIEILKRDQNSDRTEDIERRRTLLNHLKKEELEYLRRPQ